MTTTQYLYKILSIWESAKSSIQDKNDMKLILKSRGLVDEKNELNWHSISKIHLSILIINRFSAYLDHRILSIYQSTDVYNMMSEHMQLTYARQTYNQNTYPHLIPKFNEDEIIQIEQVYKKIK